jgi:hypothetical protein
MYLSIMRLLDILTEDQSYKVSYSAVVLDHGSRSAILNHVAFPNDWKAICHHMTIKMGELPENLKEKIGQTVTLRVTKLGKSDKAIAVGIETSLSQNAIPHITVAINAANGAKPKDSNEITEWEELAESFNVTGKIEEILYQVPFKAKGAPTTLNVFDFDGTLMDSPMPNPGKEKYKELTGKDWPHKGWWGQIDSLKPFDIQPIEQTKGFYNEYSTIPNSITILMTNRMAKFEPVVKEKLDGLYVFDYYDFKNDNREKPERIKDMLKNNPSIDTINIFDDMDEQIMRFNKFKEETPNLEINIFQIK